MMPEASLLNRKKKVFCCCLKKSVDKVPSECKISYSQPEESAKVPYTGDVPKDLGTGSAICITGVIKPKCTRFTIDLICRKETKTDIAFHFNPRLDRHYIVRNAFLNEQWGIEEAASTSKCDLIRNEKFEIVLLVTNDAFMVSINGKHFCIFKFRVALKLITNIEILGDIDIFDVEYKKWTIYPEIKTNAQSLVIEMEAEQVQSKELLAIPCTGHLPKGFHEGWQLEIYGRVKLLPHSFYINLQDGSQIWPHPTIVLHLNPRFKAVAGENVIVRNAWINGRWGAEERSPGFSFKPGSLFCVVIRKAHDYFSVWINGQLTGEFRFRGATEKIDTLFIQGDIVLKNIVLHNKYGELPKPNEEVIKL